MCTWTGMADVSCVLGSGCILIMARTSCMTLTLVCQCHIVSSVLVLNNWRGRWRWIFRLNTEYGNEYFGQIQNMPTKYSVFNRNIRCHILYSTEFFVEFFRGFTVFWGSEWNRVPLVRTILQIAYFGPYDFDTRSDVKIVRTSGTRFHSDPRNSPFLAFTMVNKWKSRWQSLFGCYLMNFSEVEITSIGQPL